MIVCPCGFRADGTPQQTLKAYRTHTCDLHPFTEDSGPNGWSVAALLIVCVLLSFVCTHGWGLFT